MDEADEVRYKRVGNKEIVRWLWKWWIMKVKKVDCCISKWEGGPIHIHRNQTPAELSEPNDSAKFDTFTVFAQICITCINCATYTSHVTRLKSFLCT